ncbi:M23 family metallopeptidase [Allosphingosinicella sp.]|uniref:M23 family metallopeptidase n=1 Tax=Allosphingosinicella sp. TaxID=2823234 RepID=UPI002F08F611
MYQFNDMKSGSGAATVLLSTESVFHRPVIARGFGRKGAELRRFDPDIDLVVDLGVRIGSREWFRGLATCGILCFSAYSLAPPAAAMQGASAPPMPEPHYEEARALGFTPLALGADTGRRMAPTEAVETLPEAPERPRLDLVATLGRGDGFAAVLARAGVAQAEAAEVAAMVAAHVALDQIRPGTSMNLTLGRRANQRIARPLESLTFRARLDLRLTVVRAGSQLVLQPRAIAIDETPLRIQGRVGSSLYRSARAAGAPARAVEGYIRALATQINVGDLGADDVFDIVIEHRRAETGEAETGRLLYAGLQRSSGRDLKLMQWAAGGGEPQWFEASGVGRTTGTMQRPVSGGVSSGFGMRRHPILGYSRMHRGVDFAAGYGTPILAATDGRVAAAGWAGGYGRQVRLSHSGGLVTSYSHMSRFAVSPGQTVRQGQVIGYVGSTGLSTGPHLHYELYRNGTAIDPRSVRFVTRSQLSGADLQGFRDRLRGLLALPVGGARQAAAPAPTAGARTAP